MIKAENNINYMGSVMPVQQGEIPKPARFSITVGVVISATVGWWWMFFFGFFVLYGCMLSCIYGNTVFKTEFSIDYDEQYIKMINYRPTVAFLNCSCFDRVETNIIEFNNMEVLKINGNRKHVSISALKITQSSVESGKVFNEEDIENAISDFNKYMLATRPIQALQGMSPPGQQGLMVLNGMGAMASGYQNPNYATYSQGSVSNVPIQTQQTQLYIQPSQQIIQQQQQQTQPQNINNNTYGSFVNNNNNNNNGYSPALFESGENVSLPSELPVKDGDIVQ